MKGKRTINQSTGTRGVGIILIKQVMKKTIIVTTLIALMPMGWLKAQEVHRQANTATQPIDTIAPGSDSKSMMLLPQTNNSSGVLLNTPTMSRKTEPSMSDSLAVLPLQMEPNGLNSEWVYQQNRAFARFYIYQSNWTQSYMAMGEFLKYDIALKWQPNDRLAMMAGGTFMRQYDHFSPVWKDLYGVSSSADYQLNNRTTLSLYGTYFFNARDNLFANNLLFPTSSVGTSVQYQVNKKTRIGVGIDYRYDSNKNQWKPQSGSKVSVGF